MNKYLIGLVLVLIVAVGLLGKVVWTNFKLNQANDQINSDLMSAKLEIGRAHTTIDDANKKLSSLDNELQKEVKDLKATVTLYAELEAKYEVLKIQKGKTVVQYLPGDPIEVPCPSRDFIRGILYEAITARTLVPIEEIKAQLNDERLDITCMVKPYQNTNRDIPMTISYDLHIGLNGQLIETRAPSGAINHFIKLYETDKNGKVLGQMELTKFEVIKTDETTEHLARKRILHKLQNEMYRK